MSTPTPHAPEPLFWRLAPMAFVLFWAAGYSFAKMGLPHIKPMTLLALRYSLAVLVLLPVLLVHRPTWPSGWRHWMAIAATGFLIQCVYFGLAYKAMDYGMNAGTTAIIMALQPILVATLSPLVTGSRYTTQLWLGLVLGLAGVVVVIAAGGTLGPSPWVAVLFALMALAGMTAATLFEKWHGRRTDPVVGGLVQYVVGAAVLVPVALVSGIGHIDWGTELVVSLAYLVIVNSIVSISLFVGLLQRGDATRISALMYLVPPLALLIAWVVLGEKMTSLALLGMLICITGVWLVNRAGRANPA